MGGDTKSEDTPIEVLCAGTETVAVAALRLVSVASAEAFLEREGLPAKASHAEVARAQWTEFVATLCALPQAVELLSVMGRLSARAPVHLLCVVGRGADELHARRACQSALGTVRTILSQVVRYARFADAPCAMGKPEGRAADAPGAGAEPIAGLMVGGYAIELARREELVVVGVGDAASRPMGFSPGETLRETPEKAVRHLAHWVPSDDDGSRLWRTLQDAPQGTALVVHALTMGRLPASVRREAREHLVALERLAGGGAAEHIETLLRARIEIERAAAVARAASLEGAGVVARVFLVGARPASAALIATASRFLDGSRSPIEAGNSGGGVALGRATPESALARLDVPRARQAFDVPEAAAFLRSLFPARDPVAGVDVEFARSAPAYGHGGDDAPLGVNRHGARATALRLEEEARFRHTYIVGQTGTGKSTLMLQHALHDIRAGRGVAVLDPHGALVDAILRHFPAERANDLVTLDVTDPHFPVPFNPLCITETDPFIYRQKRDLIIDDLYAFLDQTYDLAKVGGPIFESHFRGMLGLLLGVSPPVGEWAPTLMMFRSLYTNSDLRRRLTARVGPIDPVAREFMREAEDATHDASLASVAPYVTSKFTRFVSDMTLRNITCQRGVIDIDAIVRDGRVLLCDLGRGRFGDLAAGLVASQLVSRVRSAVMGRGASASARPFYLYADEFQIFADDRIGELLSEARKFRLAITLGHQFLDQLTPAVRGAVLGNVGTVVALRIGPNDASAIAPLFEPAVSGRDLLSLPNYRAYVRSLGELGHRPFSVELPPPPGPGSPRAAETLRALARARDGRPRVQVEAEIRRTYDRWLKGELLVA